jgi:hypothetical protein
MKLATRDWMAANGLLFPLLGARRRFDRQLVRRSTRLCIEGYPRSANSYALLAFRHWNPGLRVANHLHTPLQITRAVRLGVPCAVLVRPPADAVASVLVMVRGRISETAAYRGYIHFYSRAMPARDEVVVVPFDEITSDPASMVRRLNAFYGTSFASGPMTDEAEAAIRGRLEARPAERGLPSTSYPAPSAEKDRLRAELADRVVEHPLRHEAERLHAAWVRERPLVESSR